MVLEQLRAALPTMVVDGGDLFWKSKTLRDRDRPQRLLKAQTQANLLALQGMDAMVPGEGDLALGVQEYVRLTQGLPVLAGNLKCGEQRWPLTAVVQVGARKVGVIGVTAQLHPDCALTMEPLDAVEKGVAELGSVDLVLVIGHVGHTFANHAGAVPGVDFVLEGESGTARRNPTQHEGGAWQLGAGKRGKVVGVVELEFVPGATGWLDRAQVDGIQERLAQQQDKLDEAQVGLASAVGEDLVKYQTRVDFYTKEVEEAERDLLAAKNRDGARPNLFGNRLVDLQASVGEDPVVISELEALTAAVQAIPAAAPSRPPRVGPYVGSSSCRGCHNEQYVQWAQTPHASAYQTLAVKRKQLDTSCYSCHVTGAFHPEGPQSPLEVAHLKDVGCESCHGPGREHVAQPGPGQMQGTPRESSCTQCHDGVQDNGEFELEEYLEKVAH